MSAKQQGLALAKWHLLKGKNPNLADHPPPCKLSQEEYIRRGAAGLPLYDMMAEDEGSGHWDRRTRSAEFSEACETGRTETIRSSCGSF
jgi:hypothetical protein